MRPEPVEVALINERPGRFVWRGRLYTVLAVLQRPPRARSAAGGEAGGGEAGGEAGGGEAGGAASAGEEPQALRCWRVTAAPGRNVPGATFQLCQEVATGRWLLTRNGD